MRANQTIYYLTGRNLKEKKILLEEFCTHSKRFNEIYDCLTFLDLLALPPPPPLLLLQLLLLLPSSDRVFYTMASKQRNIRIKCLHSFYSQLKHFVDGVNESVECFCFECELTASNNYYIMKRVFHSRRI